MVIRRILPILVLTCFPLLGQAIDLLQDFDTLGGNATLLKKLKSGPQGGRGLRIVQNRLVDRTNRLELFSDYKYTSRGNSYLDSTSAGAALHYHFTPHWSLGFKYNHYYNKLTAEGENIVQEAQEVERINPNIKVALIPEINWPLSSMMASLSYYPIYGKVNIFNRGIVHFDIYGTLGAGRMTLRQGESFTYAAGVGFGLWLSQHISGRLEYNYQAYQAEYLLGVREQKINTLSFGLGLLL